MEKVLEDNCKMGMQCEKEMIRGYHEFCVEEYYFIAALRIVRAVDEQDIVRKVTSGFHSRSSKIGLLLDRIEKRFTSPIDFRLTNSLLKDLTMYLGCWR